MSYVKLKAIDPQMQWPMDPPRLEVHRSRAGAPIEESPGGSEALTAGETIKEE